MPKADPWTPNPGTLVLVPVTVLESIVEGGRIRHYVRAPGAHTPVVTFPSYAVTNEKAENSAASVTFIERTEAELVVGNPADGLTYRLDPSLTLEPASGA